MQTPKETQQHGADGAQITGVCVMCSQMIHHDDDAIVHRGRDIRFAYGLCEACGVPHITVEILQSGQSTSVSLLTDLKKTELRHFWNQRSISTNDVLTLRSQLREGDVESVVHRTNK
jgi:hypothetical protein